MGPRYVKQIDMCRCSTFRLRKELFPLLTRLPLNLVSEMLPINLLGDSLKTITNVLSVFLAYIIEAHL